MCWSSRASSRREVTSSGSVSTTPSSAASSQPLMLESGVRSSCATSLTMALRCSSRALRWAAMSLKAAASWLISPAERVAVVGTGSGSPAFMRRVAVVSARSGRVSRVAANAVTATVTARTAAASPARRAVLSRERLNPGSPREPSGLVMKSRAGEET